MKKKVNHIYLDMDGVITDLDLDMVNDWKQDGKFHEHFTKFIENKGFEKLGLKEDARLLLNYLNELGVSVTILSSAGNPQNGLYPEVARQKKKWLLDHNINYPAIVVQSKEYKKDYAEPGALLIDDTLSNCKDFKEAGGTSIFHGSAFSTVQLLNIEYNLIRE